MQSTPTHQLELLFSPPAPHTPPPTIRIQSTTDDPISAVPQDGEAEDEHTFSAYGDISLGEVIVPPLPPAPAHPGFGPFQSRHPQPRLRLKVRRPPMPKCRPSYTYIADPLPRTEGMDPDERWPGSPRHFVDSPSWLQHQPLASPLPADHTTSRTQGDKPAKKGGSSLEKLFDELIPRSPSIRLSPPGSPASQAFGLPRETREQESGAQQARNDAAKLPPYASPTPAPRQDKPRDVPWRTSLPPRLPIPKWDM